MHQHTQAARFISATSPGAESAMRTVVLPLACSLLAHDAAQFVLRDHDALLGQQLPDARQLQPVVSCCN